MTPEERVLQATLTFVRAEDDWLAAKVKVQEAEYVVVHTSREKCCAETALKRAQRVLLGLGKSK